MKTNVTKWLMAIVVIAITLGVNAQQSKRNLIVNSNFEEGLFNWSWDVILDDLDAEVASVSIDEDNPISGTQSAKVEVLGNAPEPWMVQLYTFFPVEEYAKYKIQFKARASEQSMFAIELCESHGNHTGFKPFDLESWAPVFHVKVDEEDEREESNVGFDPWGGDLRGWVHVDEEVTEYEFITQGNQFGFPNYTLSFMFGHASTDITYWIDDIKVSRCDDGDWDGNFLPTGNFESDRARVFNNQGYHLDAFTGNEESLAYLTEEDPISGDKSMYFYKAANETNPEFWPLSYNMLLWVNDAIKLDISLKAKSTQDAHLMMRVTGHPWGWGGGDWYQWELPLTTEVQTIRPDRTNAVGWHGKDNGMDYGSVSPIRYGWDSVIKDGYRGHISIFGSLLDSEVVENGVPGGTGIWIDDVVIKEANLYLDTYDVEYAPETVEVGKTVQFKIGDFVMPTHAPTTVEFWVDNDEGEADIDEDGNLTGIAEGKVTVNIDTPNMTDWKQFTVNVVPATGFQNLNEGVIQLSSTMVNAGDLIEIKSPVQVNFNVYDITGALIASSGANNKHIRTSGLAGGTYIVKIVADNNLTAVRKFIVK